MIRQQKALLKIPTLKSCDEVFPDMLAAHALFSILDGFIKDVINPLLKDGTIYDHFEEDIVKEMTDLDHWWKTHIQTVKNYVQDYEEATRMRDILALDNPKDIERNFDLSSRCKEKLDAYRNKFPEWEKEKQEKLHRLVNILPNLWF